MLRKQLGDVWKILPPRVRRLVVRLTQPVFTVSVGAAVINDEGKVLLLNHLLRPKSGWGIPGGFVDRGEQLENAIRREIREETGLELRDLEMVGTRTLKGHLEILFSARASGDASVKSREIIELGWFDLDEIEEKTGRRQREIIERILKNRG